MKRILLSSYLLMVISLLIVIVNIFNDYSTFSIWIISILSLLGITISIKTEKSSVFWHAILIYIIGITNIIWSGVVLRYTIQDMQISIEWEQWFFWVVLIKTIEVAVIVVVIYLLVKIFRRRNKIK